MTQLAEATPSTHVPFQRLTFNSVDMEIIRSLRAQRVSWEKIAERFGMTKHAMHGRLYRASPRGKKRPYIPKEKPGHVPWEDAEPDDLRMAIWRRQHDAAARARAGQ